MCLHTRLSSGKRKESEGGTAPDAAVNTRGRRSKKAKQSPGSMMCVCAVDGCANATGGDAKLCGAHQNAFVRWQQDQTKTGNGDGNAAQAPAAKVPCSAPIDSPSPCHPCRHWPLATGVCVGVDASNSAVVVAVRGSTVHEATAVRVHALALLPEPFCVQGCLRGSWRALTHMAVYGVRYRCWFLIQIA